MRVLETKDIVSLLRSEIKRAGSVSAWSQKNRHPSDERKQGSVQRPAANSDHHRGAEPADGRCG